MDWSNVIGALVGGGCCAFLGLGLILLVVGTIYKTRFGINFGGAECANCGATTPVVRVPRTAYQTLWGGWTCEGCGQDNDKWGNPI